MRSVLLLPALAIAALASQNQEVPDARPTASSQPNERHHGPIKDKGPVVNPGVHGKPITVLKSTKTVAADQYAERWKGMPLYRTRPTTPGETGTTCQMMVFLDGTNGYIDVPCDQDMKEGLPEYRRSFGGHGPVIVSEIGFPPQITGVSDLEIRAAARAVMPSAIQFCPVTQTSAGATFVIGKICPPPTAIITSATSTALAARTVVDPEITEPAVPEHVRPTVPAGGKFHSGFETVFTKRAANDASPTSPLSPFEKVAHAGNPHFYGYKLSDYQVSWLRRLVRTPGFLEQFRLCWKHGGFRSLVTCSRPGSLGEALEKAEEHSTSSGRPAVTAVPAPTAKADTIAVRRDLKPPRYTTAVV